MNNLKRNKMSKQTAVEWLAEKLKSQGLLIGEPNNLVAVKQAKAMEKEQIEDAFQDGKWDWDSHLNIGTESKDLAKYYNETYKGGEECSKHGVKKEGESCTLNNNCIFPKCTE